MPMFMFIYFMLNKLNVSMQLRNEKDKKNILAYGEYFSYSEILVHALIVIILP